MDRRPPDALRTVLETRRIAALGTLHGGDLSPQFSLEPREVRFVVDFAQAVTIDAARFAGAMSSAG